MRAEHQLIVEYKRRIDALVERVQKVQSENESLRAERDSLRKLLHEAGRQADWDLELIRGQERLIRRFEGVVSNVA